MLFPMVGTYTKHYRAADEWAPPQPPDALYFPDAKALTAFLLRHQAAVCPHRLVLPCERPSHLTLIDFRLAALDRFRRKLKKHFAKAIDFQHHRHQADAVDRIQSEPTPMVGARSSTAPPLPFAFSYRVMGLLSI